MLIHKYLNDENVEKIAKEYGVGEEWIREVNELRDITPAEGEELLIQMPTRTYKIQHGDTPEKLAIRFGVRKREILELNPWLCNREVKVGETIALKGAPRSGGMSVANGYYYKGCSEYALRRAMPYLTYVTFATAVADERGAYKTMDDKNVKEMATQEEKIPLIRIHDRYPERYKTKENLEDYAEEIITLALEGEYKGVVLDACALKSSAEEFISFLMILRKMMIGCDLILITEVNEESPIEFSEYADASSLYYPKYAMENPKSFDDGERRIISDFASRGESAKTFIDLPSLALMGERFISTVDALNTARGERRSIISNENTLLSHFDAGKQGECRFTSLENIRALFDLINEYNYMGICFDIMRTPLAHLMMYNSLFKTHFNTSVRSREGCSRAGEE